MADVSLVRLLTGDSTYPDYARTVKAHDLTHDGDILLTTHGRPVLIAGDFADDGGGEDGGRQILFALNPGSLVGQDDNLAPVRLPQRFVITVPPVVGPDATARASR